MSWKLNLNLFCSLELEKEWKLKMRNSFRLFFEDLTLPQMSKSKHPNNSKFYQKYSQISIQRTQLWDKSKQLSFFEQISDFKEELKIALFIT